CAADSDGFLWFKGTIARECHSARFRVVVKRVNRPPLANGLSVSLSEDTTRLVPLTGSDPDAQALTVQVTVLPSHGELFRGSSTAAADKIASVPATIPSSGNSADVTYRPAANYNGPDSFQFKTNDGVSDSTVATVAVTVVPVNDAPVAAN